MSKRTALLLPAAGLTVLVALSMAPVPAHGDATVAETLVLVDGELEARPDDASLWQRRAALERLRGHLERASADLSRAEALGLAPAIAGRDRGLLLLAGDRTAEGEAVLRRALERAPEDVTILLPHARALASLGRWRESADAYAALVGLAPDASPDVHLERVRALEALGPPACDEALRAVDAAVARLGPVPALEQAAIAVALGAGRTHTALARLEALAAASKRPEGLLLQRAAILEDAGRPEEAAATYGAALAALERLPKSRRATAAAAEIEAEAKAGILRIATIDTPHETAAAVDGVPR